MRVDYCDRCETAIDDDNPAIGRPYSVTKYQETGRRRQMDLCRSCQNGLNQWWSRKKGTSNA
jgi:hypothetical protein